MPMTNAAEYLERTAARVPDKVAFSDASGSLTFGQLLTRARALGTVLAGLPGCKNAPVAVLTGRTVQSVAALQGVLQSGNYYVPIDEQMPEARMRRILAQVHARAIVFPEACRPQAERLADCAPLVCLERRRRPPGQCASAGRREQIIDLDPVYLLFTSGSTGTPKGIVISHRAILDFTDWLTDFCGYTEHEVFGNQSPFYFDTSCKDLYQTLKLGATCVILEKKFFALPLFLLQALDRNGVTAVNWATSAFHLAAMLRARLKSASRTRCGRSSSAAEALQARYVNMWKRAIPGGDLYNMYGPTETTVDCAALHLTRTYRDDEPTPSEEPAAICSCCC